MVPTGPDVFADYAPSFTAVDLQTPEPIVIFDAFLIYKATADADLLSERTVIAVAGHHHQFCDPFTRFRSTEKDPFP